MGNLIFASLLLTYGHERAKYHGAIYNRCQNCWNELQIFHTYQYLAPPLPRTMLCYCGIRLASRRIRSFSRVATSYLQNPALFSGGRGLEVTQTARLVSVLFESMACF